MHTVLVSELERKIEDFLVPRLKGRNCVLLDVPYYANVGDTLIWQGTEDFLRKHKVKVLYTASKETFDFRKIDNNVVILLQGGGNFGDLWVLHQEFRRQVISRYPNNPIIILPQSICFENKHTQETDALFFNNYPNVTICVRDRVSFAILERYYSNNGHALLPDMAFCIDKKRYKIQKKNLEQPLFVRRQDKELSSEDYFSIVPKNAVVKDWLSFGNLCLCHWKNRIEKCAGVFDSIFGASLKSKVTDFLWRNLLKRSQIQYAIDFLMPYDHIYTTRMHAAILSVILGKKDITLFDNSYGKLSSFVEAWLKDVDGLRVLGNSK